MAVPVVVVQAVNIGDGGEFAMADLKALRSRAELDAVVAQLEARP